MTTSKTLEATPMPPVKSMADMMGLLQTTKFALHNYMEQADLAGEPELDDQAAITAHLVEQAMQELSKLHQLHYS